MPLNLVQRRTPWFRGKVTYIKPGARDLYGAPTTDERVELPATPRTAMIEVIEANGTRAKRQALIIEVGTQDFFAMNDHLAYDSQEYTIIGIDKLPDYKGVVNWVKITAVAKRGNV